MGRYLELADKAIRSVDRDRCASSASMERNSIWTVECERAAEKFGPHGRLYPFIGHKVWTVRGVGVLEQVLGPKVVRIALNKQPDRMVTVAMEDVMPLM